MLFKMNVDKNVILTDNVDVVDNYFVILNYIILYLRE